MDPLTTPFHHIFLEGEYGIGVLPKPVPELDILHLLTAIREKPDWHAKIADPSITSKWKEEASNMQNVEKKMQYALAELQWVASRKNAETGVQPSTVDGTFESDNLIPPELRNALISAVSPLESVPESQKDWHPGTDNQVLDLVHPSLFPLVIGKSPVLKNAKISIPIPINSNEEEESYNNLLYFANEDEILPPEESGKLALKHLEGKDVSEYSKSAKFQWLPSDVQVDEEGKKVNFLSYVNNLHPEHHPELYSCLEKILAKFLPMFEGVLTELRHPRPNRIVIHDYNWYGDYDEEGNGINFKPVEIPEFQPPPSNPPTTVSLNGRRLQVIVKLANIHLTPEKPKYPGGVWHVEGMANERIIASGIYYYDVQNITESRLCFRQAIKEPDYEQYDNNGVRIVYNLEDAQGLNQEVGSILAREGRCIAFPNTMQHRVAPFELADPTRPGHRKILVFFLVDPTVEILSTARVPPQQKAWFLNEVQKGPSPNLPELVVDRIVQLMPWPLTLKEAKGLREDLMQERKFFVKSSNEWLFERPFSLCEH